MATAIVAGLLAHAGPASSAGGTLDSGFGSSGARTIDHGASSDDIVADLVIQTDGKVLVVSDTASGFGLSRLTTAGVLDTTYGSSGSTTDTYLIDPGGLALDSNGKALVVGTTDSGGDLTLARYSTTGDLDTTFGTSGIVEVAMAGTASGGRDIAVQTDGKIVVLSVDGGVLVIHRFSSAGVLDTTFGTSGKATTTATAGSSDRLLLQSDGAVLLTGVVTNAGVLRYTSAGVLDTTFDTDGIATTSGHVIRAMALQTDGKIITGGDDGSTSALVARRTTVGALDTTFDTDGVFSFSVPGLSKPTVRAAIMDSSSKVLLAGRQNDSADSSVVFIARLTTAGALDTTFATDGIVTFTTLASKGTSTAQAIAVDSSARAVVGGAIVDGSDVDAVVLRATTADGQTTTTSSTSTTASSGTAVDEGETIRTHGTGTEVDEDTPLKVALVAAADGTAALTLHDEPEAEYENLRTFLSATVTTPTGTADEPNVLTFTIYAGLFPSSFPLGSIAVAKDGEIVEPCLRSDVADPDPCVSSRTSDGTTIVIEVLTTSGSEWDIGVSDVERLAGEDRIGTSIAMSRSSFPEEGSADAVVLVRSDSFADALAATVLAADRSAPLLLTGSDALDDAVLEEIIRVLPEGETVYLLGGTAALGTSVEERLASWGFDSTRYAGDDRFETAAVVAERALNAPSVVIETTGLSFADALAAGAVATHLGGAVLLTNGSSQSAATRAYLAEHSPDRYAIGGPATVADPDATGIAGTDRYETAVLSAIEFFDAPEVIGFASGADYPDALAGGTHIALSGGPLLLVPASGDLPVSLTIYLDDLAGDDPPSAFLYGGTTAVDDTVAGLLSDALLAGG